MKKNHVLQIRIPGDTRWVTLEAFRARWNARLSAWSLRDVFETRIIGPEEWDIE